MVSASRPMLFERMTTASWTAAVANNPANDHFTAQMPRSEDAIEGSMCEWLWPCSAMMQAYARYVGDDVRVSLREIGDGADSSGDGQRDDHQPPRRSWKSRQRFRSRMIVHTVVR